MSEETIKVLGVVALVAAFIFGVDVVKPFAAWIGSDFWTTFWASAESLIAFGLIIVGAIWLDSELLPLAIAIAAQISWFFWWPVLNSVACNGCDPDKPSSGGLHDLYSVTGTSPDSLWIRWGIAAVIFTGIVVLIFRRREHY